MECEHRQPSTNNNSDTYRSSQISITAHIRVQPDQPPRILTIQCMDRQRRSSSKVTDYRQFHLSGDLEQVVQGKVSNTVGLWEVTTALNNTMAENLSTEKLEIQLKE